MRIDHAIPLRLITIWVNTFGEIESVAGGDVSVCRSNGQNETRLFRNELHDHVADLCLDINRLVSHRDLSQAGKIDQRDVQN